MNAKIPVFVICVKVIIFLLLYDLRGRTFKISPVNVTKSAGNYGFGHIYCGNP